MSDFKPISADLADAIRSARTRQNSSPDNAPKKARYSAPKSRAKLSRAQVSKLLILARDAWRIHGEPDGVNFHDWRHAEVMAAAGVPGLTKAANHQFRAIQSHFLALLGRDLESVQSAMATGPAGPGETIEDREQAVFVLRRETKRRGLSENYAAAIGRQRFKKSALEFLTAAEAMTILMEITRLYTPVPEGSPPVRAAKGPNSQGGRNPRPYWGA